MNPKCAKCELPRYSTSGYCREHHNEYKRLWNKEHYVYIIENTLTNKKYYGSTCQRYRWYYHKRYASTYYACQGRLHWLPLYVDIREQGVENFTFTKVATYTVKQDARDHELELILADEECYNTLKRHSST